MHSTLSRGHWDGLIGNLGYGGRYLETGRAFLSQD